MGSGRRKGLRLRDGRTGSRRRKGLRLRTGSRRRMGLRLRERGRRYWGSKRLRLREGRVVRVGERVVLLRPREGLRVVEPLC